MPKYLIYHPVLPVLLFFFVLTSIAASAQTNEITLKDAISRAISQNPGLKAQQSMVKAANGQIIQAGLRPNPEISLEFEKFGGNSNFAGTGQLEDSLAISQEIVTGGKRFYKIKSARIEKLLTIAKAKLAQRELIEDVCRTWLKIHRLNKLIEIEKEFVSLGTQNLEAIKRKVAAGEAPIIDETKAQVETATIKTELRKMQREKEALKHQLASLWGDTNSDFNISFETSNLFQHSHNLSHQLEEILDQVSEVAIARLQKDLASADYELSRAQSRADFSLEGGIVRERADNKHHYFVGVSVPLQIFNRNQGNRTSTRAMIDQADKNLEQTKLSVRAQLIELFENSTSISDELKTASSSLLPTAKEAFAQVQRAYDQGERELFELIDARRVKLEAEKAVIQLENEELEILMQICLKTDCQNLLNDPDKEMEHNHDN